MLHATSPKSTSIVAANLHGPAQRNIRKTSKIMDTDSDQPIVDRDFKVAVKVVVQLIKEHFVKTDSVTISASIDGTRIPNLAQANYRHKKIFGGAAPDHCIDLSEDDHDGSKLSAILDLLREITQNRSWHQK